MTHWFSKNGRRICSLTVLLILFCAAPDPRAQDFFAGARGGLSFESDGGRFHQVEIFGGANLPWRWNFYSNWYLRPGADASGGWLSDSSDSGFIGSIGPFVNLGKGGIPVTLEGGVAPTFLSRHSFSSRNFGGNVQFTSYIGLDWRMTRHFTLGARFQHMSNASISHPNPGLNMGLFSLRYDF